jgi:hypothetical protein
MSLKTLHHTKPNRRALPILAVAVFALILGLRADEGMFPVSEISRLDLKSRGLEIDPARIFSEDESSLIYAIVQVGATGSFVSPEGLILTNHHVAFGAAQAASSTENDYIRDGFLARSHSAEIEAKGMTARITESFRDVSAEVLSVVRPGLSPEARTLAIQKKRNEIVAAAEKANPGKRAEVAEMFAGKTYVLFLYTHLRDIRLVYVPPRSIGEFGGETDNWMWPRHTGDFSFLRAYVAPDGSPAAFSPENIPYRPKVYLEVEPRGVAENDFVFLLGYPGRTFRHRTSHYLAYEEEFRMPDVADWYAWQIALMEQMSDAGRDIAIRHAGRIKGLSNTMKNFQGKLKGMARVGIVENKRAEEEALQTWITSDAKHRAAAGDLFDKFAAVYDEIRSGHELSQVMLYLRQHVNLLGWASIVYEAALERAKPDLERESAYMDRNFDRTKQRIALGLENYYEPTDRAVLEALLLRAARLPKENQIPAFAEISGAADPVAAAAAFIDNLYGNTRMADPAFVAAAWDKPAEELKKSGDAFIDLAVALHPLHRNIKSQEDAWNGRLDPLYARLLDLKADYLAMDFIPDANSTLRLTFGRIKGYSPADAVYYHPVTTLTGVLEKTTGVEPFDTPEGIFDLAAARDFGPYKPEDRDSVPVCILYDADTTGGNSGSPVLDARGRLVGVNFDRTYEATINDFAWSADYSRSIAVDIRYVLWVTEKFGGADFLLKEMNVK